MQTLRRSIGTFLFLNTTAYGVAHYLAATLLPSFSQHPIHFVLVAALSAFSSLLISGIVDNLGNRSIARVAWRSAIPAFVVTLVLILFERGSTVSWAEGYYRQKINQGDALTVVNAYPT